MGNEWGKNLQKNGDSVPDNFHFPPRNSFVSSRIPDFFIASDSFPAIQESMVTPPQKKAQKLEK